MSQHRPRRTGSLPCALAALAVLAHALACGAAPDATSLPDGALVVARTDGLAALLDRLAALEGTPLAARARALRAGLPACEMLEARATSGRLADAAKQLACAAPGGALAQLHELRGARDLAFARPLEGGARLLGALAISDAGDVELELSLPVGALADARRLLLPGRTPPGPGLLASAEAILQARVRPDAGLDLASLVAEGDEAARLFRLKSRLFSGAVLDGTWEIAVYVPAERRPMPDAALAVGFALRAPAVAAMESFLREIQQTWPVHRSFFAVDGAEGACLLDLTLLPELAPCYVATERALIVGWNPASLRRALAPGTRRPGGGAVVDLERLADADARLARALSQGPAPFAWPWKRLRANGERQGESLRVRVVLEAGADA